MVYNLYPLLPSLKPCENVGTTDTCYLNPPIINPLKIALYIELYNEKRFDKPLKISIPPFIYKHDTLKLSIESMYPFNQVLNFMTNLTLALLNLYLRQSMIIS